ncbi:hypothetical protein ACLKA6_001112 [Drosophila palustris]
MAPQVEANPQSSGDAPINREGTWTKVTSRTNRARSANCTYADLLKTVKTHPGLANMGNDVQGIRNQSPMQLQSLHSSVGYVRAQIKGVWLFSCYMAPSLSMAEFSRAMDDLVEDVRGHSPAVFAGDFNGAVEWGSTITNARGRVLLDAFASLDVDLLNQGSIHTFSRGGVGMLQIVTSQIRARGVPPM